MAEISVQTLMMAIQGVAAEIDRIKDSVNGDVAELVPDDQDFLLAYSQAEMELKQAYLAECEADPDLPSYEHLIGNA